jgi:hypothetical protein
MREQEDMVLPFYLVLNVSFTAFGLRAAICILALYHIIFLMGLIAWSWTFLD